jgi:hypothetical protein
MEGGSLAKEAEISNCRVCGEVRARVTDNPEVTALWLQVSQQSDRNSESPSTAQLDDRIGPGFPSDKGWL